MFKDPIPVVDLFAGPGGLGEGFSAFSDKCGHPFEICLSIEKDPNAYRTLRLRSLFRKLNSIHSLEAYIDFAKTVKSEKDEEYLYSGLTDLKKEIDWEILCKELGNNNFPHNDVDSIIKDHISGSKIWVLIGGPPCQAYSVVGRSRMSKERKKDLSKFETDERHYLYQHYLRIIDKHNPPVFVMENVKGILSSTINGRKIIDRILKDLRDPGSEGTIRYNLYSFVHKPKEVGIFDGRESDIPDFVIKAEEYGVPQTRHRVIILGIRSDINYEPKTIKKNDTFPCVKDVISDLPKIRSEVSLRFDKNSTLSWGDHIRKFSQLALRNNVSDDIFEFIEFNMDHLGTDLSTGKTWMPYGTGRPKMNWNNWYRSPELLGVCNHEARGHMPSDLWRYYFALCFVELQVSNNTPRSPILSDFPDFLLPNHKNIDPNNLRNTVFNDRFRVQLWDKPATTITSHISKDGHYFIHPDIRQCRSLTVREAARIQTFPDSYIFLGSRTAQYQQVGNAVPPLLAKQLAEVTYDLLFRWSEGY